MKTETILAILALLFSAINIVFYVLLTIKCNAMSKTQMLTAQGALEAQIRSLISNATKELTHYAVSLEKEPDSNVLQQSFLVAEESYRNAYEEACSKYIDGKVDKGRFEKSYKQEIYKLINNNDQKKFYATNQSTYNATLAVYKEWYGQA